MLRLGTKPCAAPTFDLGSCVPSIEACLARARQKPEIDDRDPHIETAARLLNGWALPRGIEPLFQP